MVRLLDCKNESRIKNITHKSRSYCYQLTPEDWVVLSSGTCPGRPRMEWWVRSKPWGPPGGRMVRIWFCWGGRSLMQSCQQQKPLSWGNSAVRGQGVGVQISAKSGAHVTGSRGSAWRQSSGHQGGQWYCRTRAFLGSKLLSHFLSRVSDISKCVWSIRWSIYLVISLRTGWETKVWVKSFSPGKG